MSNLKREAAYMYLESRRILTLSDRLKDATSKIHRLNQSLLNTRDPKSLLEIRKHLHKITRHVKELSEQHNRLLTKLRYHHLNFEHYLREQHFVRK